MHPVEIIFSVAAITLSVATLAANTNYIPVLFMTIIGANPYVTAICVMTGALGRWEVLKKISKKRAELAVVVAWIGWPVFLALTGGNKYFIGEYIQLSLSIFLFSYSKYTLNTQSNLDTVLSAIMFSGLFLGIVEIVTALANVELYTAAYIQSIASNYTAFYICISCIVIPVSCRHLNKTYVWLLIAVGLWAITINESRAMQLLAIFIIAKDVVLTRRMLIFAPFIISISVAYVYHQITTTDVLYNKYSVLSVFNWDNNFSNLERVLLLTHSWNEFVMFPLGQGLGSSADVIRDNPLTFNDFHPHPHNTLAFMAIELGCVGIIIYFMIFISYWKMVLNLKCKRHSKLGMNILISLFIYSIADVLFYNGIQMLVVAVLLGIVASLPRLGSQSSR